MYKYVRIQEVIISVAEPSFKSVISIIRFIFNLLKQA